MHFPTKTIATALAAALGGGWTVTHPEDGNAYITRSTTGLSLVVHEAGYQTGRAQVSVMLTREESAHAYQALYPVLDLPTTTFDPARLTKQPRAVASQVERNVVEKAESEYARLKVSMARTNTYENAQRANLDALGLEDGRTKGYGYFRDGGEVWGSAQVTDTKVALDLHGLTIEQAKAVLDLLRG